MDFDLIFENTGRQRIELGHFNYLNNQNAYQKQYGFDKHYINRTLIGQILNNPKLEVAILIGLAIITGILFLMVALMFPLLKNLVDYLLENGVSGITDKVVIFLETLWNSNK